MNIFDQLEKATGVKFEESPEEWGAQPISAEDSQAQFDKMVAEHEKTLTKEDKIALNETYAPAIKQLRAEKGWSVAALANKCGVSPRTVEGWEQGRMPSVPALKILEKII